MANAPFIDAVIIRYNPIDRAILVESNMSTFEALGLLEAAKAIISNNWLYPKNEMEGN